MYFNAYCNKKQFGGLQAFFFCIIRGYHGDSNLGNGIESELKMFIKSEKSLILLSLTN